MGYLWVIIFGSFSDQVDGLHQQIVVKVLVYLQQKVQADFALRKGNDQSGKVENEVFETFGFLFDFHVVKGREVRSRIVISEVCFEVSQFFCVDEFESLFPNVVKCSILYTASLICIFETKDPHFLEVNEVRETIRILLFHFHIFGVVVEGKADLADGSRLLIFCCINNEALKFWFLFGYITAFFLIDD